MLKEQLGEKDEQIKALMPGPQGDSRSPGGDRLGRRQALKYALLGRP